MAWIFIYIIGMIATWLGPWWLIVPVSLLAGWFFPINGKTAFAQGVAGVGLLWGVSTVTIHLKNSGILADRVAPILFLPEGWSLVIVSTLIGALLGGLSCFTGWKLRDIFVS